MSKALPPSSLLMEISNNPSQEDFEASFNYVRDDFLNILKMADLNFHAHERILDFGCGVGRFLYSISNYTSEDQKLYGCDVSQRCATWCKENIDFADCHESNIEPPLLYTDGFFDLVYACSVFSHLPISFQLKWALEIFRIISSGGSFLFTTHGTAYFPVLQQAVLDRKITNSTMISIGGSGLFFSFDSDSSISSLGQREIASAHNREAIEEIFPFFDIKLHIPDSQIAASQDAYVLCKSEKTTSITSVGNKDFNKRKSSDSEWETHFSVNLTGQNLFHGFINLDGCFAGNLTLQVFIKTEDGTVIFESNFILASSRVFGKAMYYPVKLIMQPFEDKAFVSFYLDGVEIDNSIRLIRPIFY